MKLRTVDETTVGRLLTPAAARRLMRATLRASALGDAHGPMRAVLAAAGGWLGAMPATVTLDELRGLGAKLVTAFPGNAARSLPTHQALIAMFDPETGTLIGLVGGETITERRTAAVSVVATERLARRPRGALAILGSGVQARAHLEAFADAGLVERVHVWSPRPARAAALAQRANEIGLQARAFDDVAAALRDADVVVTATASPTPLFAAEAVADGTHLNAVGACVPDRRELPSDLVADANVYVDSLEAATREAGDVLIAASELGEARIRICAELGAMLADPERRDPPARVTIFKSLGLGIEDVACAAFVLAQPM
jgi:ornithine cyclodeaminase/alanine dehydrogenase-like protein (mu-crystallin family)